MLHTAVHLAIGLWGIAAWSGALGALTERRCDALSSGQTQRVNLARALRIFGTPTIIVNNRILTQPSAEMDFPAIVAEARARR